MATQEEVAQLREEVVRLRAQVVTITAAEQGARAQLDEDLKVEIRAVHAHLRSMQEKVDEDRGAVQFDVAQIRELARNPIAAAAAPGLPHDATNLRGQCSGYEAPPQPKEGVRGNPNL